jgi:heat shock protein HslJ
MARTTNRISRPWGKIYAVGIALVCAFVLISADDCESLYLAEQEAAKTWAQEAASGESAVSGSQNTSSSRNAGSGSQNAASGSQNASRGGSSPQAGSPAGSQSAAQGGSRDSGSRPSQTASSGSAQPGPAAQGATAQSPAAQGTAAQGGAQSAAPGATATTGADYVSSITGKTWKLSELRLSGRTVTIDRNKLAADGMGDLFTFTVDNERISGRAAPNRYTTVYQAGANNALTIQPPITTMMASIYDPERLREREYFQYLTAVKSWKLNQNKLELYTVDASNKEVVLVYGN